MCCARVAYLSRSLPLLALAACAEGGPTGPSDPQPPVFTYEGISYDIGSIYVKSETSFDRPGLRVYFLRAAGTTCEGLSLFLEGASAFYPETGSGYAGPISISFRVNGTSSSEGTSGGYPGAITSVGSTTVSGWIRALELGFNDDSSIDVTFTATRCSG